MPCYPGGRSEKRALPRWPSKTMWQRCQGSLPFLGRSRAWSASKSGRPWSLMAMTVIFNLGF